MKELLLLMHSIFYDMLYTLATFARHSGEKREPNVIFNVKYLLFHDLK